MTSFAPRHLQATLSSAARRSTIGVAAAQEVCAAPAVPSALRRKPTQAPQVQFLRASRRWRSAAAQPVCESEWRLYAALEKKDESAHVALARFVTAFNELHHCARTGTDQAAHEEKKSNENKEHVLKLQGYHQSCRLPKVITPQAALELLDRCKEGSPVAASTIVRLLSTARSKLLEESVVRRIPAPTEPGESVVVVGDLHGSISDLAAAIRRCGQPGPGKATYIFNGDFVDRGQHSCEVISALCALKLAHPDHVHLNRGNHECKALTRSYGLQRELRSKYKGHHAASIFKEMSALFAALPLAAVVGGKPGDHIGALVLHAGVPSTTGTTLRDIEETAMRDHRAMQVVSKESCESSKILEDLLWSDPVPADSSDAIQPNKTRNAGCTYGLGAAHNFLKREGLSTLVRSHEVVFKGVDRSDCGEGTELYTVFSASNYPDKRGSNHAAAIRFVPPSDRVSSKDDPEAGLTGAIIERWATTKEDEPQAVMDTTTAPRSAKNSVQTLSALIARHRHAILELCQQAEAKERKQGKCDDIASGLLSLAAWSKTMSAWGENNGIALPPKDWQALLPLLRTICPSEGAKEAVPQTGSVDYVHLLDGFQVQVNKDSDSRGLSEKAIMGLYENHAELSMIFSWMDADNSGTLDLDEVRKACEVLNQTAEDRDAEPVDPEALFRAMDIDQSGQLDRSEFMECFRLMNARSQ